MEQQPQQGQPQAQPNQYYKENVKLKEHTDRITGADQARLAQAGQAGRQQGLQQGVQAGKAQAETEIMAGLGMLSQPGPVYA